MLQTLFLQGNLLLWTASIVEEDWQDTGVLRCLCSDPLSQANVSWNGQDKQNHPGGEGKSRKVQCEGDLLVLARLPRLQDGFHGSLVHKLVNIP